MQMYEHEVGGGEGYTGRGISGTVQEFRTHSRNFARIPDVLHTKEGSSFKEKISRRNYEFQFHWYLGEKCHAFREICVHSWNLTRIQGNSQTFREFGKCSIAKFHWRSLNFACFRGVLSAFKVSLSVPEFSTFGT
jgi:hypothetical protein